MTCTIYIKLATLQRTVYVQTSNYSVSNDNVICLSIIYLMIDAEGGPFEMRIDFSCGNTSADVEMPWVVP